MACIENCSSSLSIFEISGKKKLVYSASSGSFNVKNDNIHSFFRCFGCKF